MVVREVGFQDTMEMALAEDDDMVEAFSPYRAHEALGIWVLPGGARGRENLLDADALDATSELLAVDAVAVAGRPSPGTAR